MDREIRDILSASLIDCMQDFLEAIGGWVLREQHSAVAQGWLKVGWSNGGERGGDNNGSDSWLHSHYCLHDDGL